MNAVNYLIHANELLIKGRKITRKKGSAFTDPLLHANVLYRLPHFILISLGDKYYLHFTDKKIDTQKD